MLLELLGNKLREQALVGSNGKCIPQDAEIYPET